MGFIYKITNNQNSKIYIGKTSSTLEERWNKHKYAYLIYDWHLYRAMRKYGIENFQIEEIEKCSDDILNDRERYWISFYDSYNNGYNSTEGGDGRIQLNRELIKEKWELGLSCKQIASDLETWSSSVSDILKELGLYNEEEIRYRKMLDVANTQSERKVIQYNEEGNIVNIYNSVLEAARSVNGLSSSIWSSLTSGGSRYGYFWGREGDKKPNFHKIIRPQNKKIYQYDKDNNFIQEFTSAAEAARSLNSTDSSGILKACKGQRKTALGFIWSYERR